MVDQFILDECVILHLLEAPPAASNTERLQNGALNTVIDMYDRKVTRDEFIAGIGHALNLYGQCAKLYVLAHVKGSFDRNELNAADFKTVEEALVARISGSAQYLTKLVERMQLCPNKGDAVN